MTTSDKYTLPGYDDDAEEDFYDSGNERDTELGNRQQPGSNSNQEEDEALDGLDLDDLMRQGRKILLADLVKLVNSGQATPAEKNTLRQMLKDNGMVVGWEGGSADDPIPVNKKKADLPSYEDPDYS